MIPYNRGKELEDQDEDEEQTEEEIERELRSASETQAFLQEDYNPFRFVWPSVSEFVSCCASDGTDCSL